MQAPDAPGVTLDNDKVKESSMAADSADQATATDQPVGGQPSSGEADPMATGTF